MKTHSALMVLSLCAACQPTARSVTPAPAPAIALHLSLTPLSARDHPEAEDGSGHMVASRAPVALDAVSPDPWPARALDPALTVGSLRFYRYTYQSDGVLRFIAADLSALTPGALASVQYGDDPRSRVSLGAVGAR